LALDSIFILFITSFPRFKTKLTSCVPLSPLFPSFFCWMVPVQRSTRRFPFFLRLPEVHAPVLPAASRRISRPKGVPFFFVYPLFASLRPNGVDAPTPSKLLRIYCLSGFPLRIVCPLIPVSVLENLFFFASTLHLLLNLVFIVPGPFF